jgi:hypothetical protein
VATNGDLELATHTDPALLRSHEEGRQALRDGDVLDSEQLAEAMMDAGRHVGGG